MRVPDGLSYVYFQVLACYSRITSYYLQSVNRCRPDLPVKKSLCPSVRSYREFPGSPLPLSTSIACLITGGIGAPNLPPFSIMDNNSFAI